MKKWIVVIFTMLVLCCNNIYAGTQVFDQVEWNLMTKVPLTNTFLGDYWLQSMVRIGDDLILIENNAIAGEFDVVKKYHWTVDEDGNTSYELTKEVKDHDYEHANGMTYNPDTNLIYIAYSTSHDPNLKGSIGILNPDTLEFVGSKKLFEDKNVTAIDYDRYTQSFVVMTGVGYIFQFDENFDNVKPMGYINPTPGKSFQDIVVSGDYVIALPVDTSQHINKYVLIYSLSQKEIVATLEIQCDDGEQNFVEGEGLVKLSEGEFQIGAMVPLSNGQREIHFFHMSIPYVKNPVQPAASLSENTVSENTVSVNALPAAPKHNDKQGRQQESKPFIELEKVGKLLIKMKEASASAFTWLTRRAVRLWKNHHNLRALILSAVGTGFITMSIVWMVRLKRIQRKRRAIRRFDSARRARLKALFQDAENDIERYEKGNKLV